MREHRLSSAFPKLWAVDRVSAWAFVPRRYSTRSRRWLCPTQVEGQSTYNVRALRWPPCRRVSLIKFAIFSSDSCWNLSSPPLRAELLWWNMSSPSAAVFPRLTGPSPLMYRHVLFFRISNWYGEGGGASEKGHPFPVDIHAQSTHAQSRDCLAHRRPRRLGHPGLQTFPLLFCPRQSRTSHCCR